MFTASTHPFQPPSRAQRGHLLSQRGAARYWVPVVLAALVALGMAGCTTLDEQQRRWIFQPSDRTWSGGLAAAQGMQDVWIQFQPGRPDQARSAVAPVAPAADAQPASTKPLVHLHALWLPQDNPAAPVLLYLHGARWDVRGSAHRMRRLHEMGFSVLGVDYRGFGQSTPALPSEASAVEDALAAWHWLGHQWPQSQRFVFGHSLGSAVAVQMAARVTALSAAPENNPPAARSPLAGLIVEGSFPSIPDVFKTLRWGWLPLQPFITQRFDAGQQIARVAAPVLVVHGSEDRLIKPELGRALYEKAQQPKRFLLVQGGSHHNTNAVGQVQVRAALTDLFGLPAVAQR